MNCPDPNVFMYEALMLTGARCDGVFVTKH
jgi:hypothetical protein